MKYTPNPSYVYEKNLHSITNYIWFCTSLILKKKNTLKVLLWDNFDCFFTFFSCGSKFEKEVFEFEKSFWSQKYRIIHDKLHLKKISYTILSNTWKFCSSPVRYQFVINFEDLENAVRKYILFLIRHKLHYSKTPRICSKWKWANIMTDVKTVIAHGRSDTNLPIGNHGNRQIFIFLDYIRLDQRKFGARLKINK